MKRNILITASATLAMLINLNCLGETESESQPTLSTPKGNASTFTEYLDHLGEPISIDRVKTYGDGGTLHITLKGPSDKQMSLCLSAPEGWEPMPPNTIFIGADYPYEEKARLPHSKTELENILLALRKARHDSLGKQSCKWLMERLNVANKQAFMSGGVENLNWYHGYVQEKGRRIEARAVHARRRAQFYRSFPPALHNNFATSTGDPPSSQEILKRSEKILSHYDLRMNKLCMAVYNALGSYENETWIGEDERTLVLEKVLERVPISNLTQTIDLALKEHRTAIGCARALFSWRLHLELDEKTWSTSVVRAAEVALSSDSYSNRIVTIKSIFEREGNLAPKILYSVALGELGSPFECSSSELKEVNRGFGGIDPRLDPRLAALLFACMHSDTEAIDFDAITICNRNVDKKALQVSKAIRNENHSIPEGCFKTGSSIVSNATLHAVKKSPTKKRIDFLISEGLADKYDICRKSILILQKIAGESWVPSNQSHLACKYKDNAIAWWQKEKPLYIEDATEIANE